MRQALRKSFVAALPIVAGYIVLGIPCGILSAQAGMNVAQIALMCLLFYSGAGQYLIANLWMSGIPIASIIVSVSLVNMRQMLYSASLARFCEHARKRVAFLFGATVTDESFGVNLARFETDSQAATFKTGSQGATFNADLQAATVKASSPQASSSQTCSPQASSPQWGAREATLVNLFSLSSWTLSTVAGALIGNLFSVPASIASFAMTSIFLCLLFMQRFRLATVIGAVVAALGVLLCKLLGFSGVAIFVGAILGIFAAMLAGNSAEPRQ